MCWLKIDFVSNLWSMNLFALTLFDGMVSAVVCDAIGILGVDVSEDYRGETRDVKRTRGRNYRFTFGDYLVKILVGTIDPTVHDIDLPDSLCAGCAIM